MFFRGSDHIIRIGSNLGKSAEADWKKDFFHKEDEMKDKVLFANAGIAKFMALLVTLLTMFASCNFVGGQDARTVVKGINPPPKYERPGEGTTFGGIFKSPIIGVDLCVWEEPGWSDGMDIKGNSFTSGSNRAAGAHFGSMDPDTKSSVGIDPYDVSKIAYAKFKFECDADISESAFSVTLFGNSERGEEVEISEAKANVEQVIKLDVLDNPGTNNTLFSVFIGVNQYGKQFKIFDFAFYDKDGNEVVPKIVETN